MLGVMQRGRLADLKRECLPKLALQALWKENEVFSKLLYRGKNQHRHDKSFQMMTRVRRDLSKYQLVNIFAKMKHLIEELFRAGAGQTVAPTTAQLATDSALRLLECATFTADLLCFAEDTWSEVHQRLVRNLFVPYNLLMLASLSRIWFCLRYHLLGIAEMYHSYTTKVLSAAILSSAELPSSVRDHLRECYRKYLTTPTDQQASLSIQETVASSCKPKGGSLATARSDMGVPVALSSAEQQARMRDFSVGAQLHLHGNQQSATPNPTPHAPVKTTREGERWKKLYWKRKQLRKALRKGKVKGKVREKVKEKVWGKMKEKDMPKTVKPGEKKKRRYSHRGRKRLLKRRLAREKALKDKEGGCEETVQDLQAQFQQQLESAAQDVGSKAGHSAPHTASCGGEGEGGDEIDRIFHSLQ